MLIICAAGACVWRARRCANKPTELFNYKHETILNAYQQIDRCPVPLIDGQGMAIPLVLFTRSL